MAQPRMNTASRYHSRFFGIVGFSSRLRTVTAEAAGSSPVDPAIKFNGLHDAPSGRLYFVHKNVHKTAAFSGPIGLLRCYLYWNYDRIGV
jgi:hypothetical protein